MSQQNIYIPSHFLDKSNFVEDMLSVYDSVFPSWVSEPSSYAPHLFNLYPHPSGILVKAQIDVLSAYCNQVGCSYSILYDRKGLVIHIW